MAQPGRPNEIPLPEGADAGNQSFESTLNNTLERLRSVVESTNISSAIQPFDGKAPENFNNWILDCEKQGLLAQMDSKDLKYVLYRCSKGQVSSFTKRRLTNASTRDESWASFNLQLAARFAYITDDNVAFLMLRNTKQDNDETVISFFL